MGGRSAVDKIAAILFPISAFVAAGFEHSTANLYFIPLGIFLHSMHPGVAEAGPTWMGFLQNIVPVSLGNIVGGGVMVGVVYSAIYRRRVESAPEEPSQPPSESRS
jgi:formate/nitrite transporter FocA (FNT family)